MKTILAATDFSAAAHNACVYAASLAKVFDARLVVYHAYQEMFTPALETTVFTATPEARKISEERLSREAASLDLFGQLSVDTVMEDADPAFGIQEAAVNCRADVIIVGMKALGKGMRRILGSTVTSLIAKVEVPIIVVPEDYQSGRLKTIAFATDTDADLLTDVHVLRVLRELGERFSCKLYLVHVAKDEMQEAFEVLNPPTRISKIVSSLEPVFQPIIGKKVTRALNDFVDEHQIDMLALLPHKHSLLGRWFMKSTTVKMVFDAKIPLLILPTAEEK